MKSVLITGSNGFTASYLARSLANAGFRVIGAARRPVTTLDFHDVVSMDVSDVDGIRRQLRKLLPEYVINLAGISFVGHGDLTEFYKVNTVGCQNLLEALTDEVPNIEQVILASSANVYGVPIDEAPLIESTTPAPVNHYAMSKVAMESVAMTFSNYLPITVTRPFNYFGYGQNESFVVPKIVSNFARGISEIELGDTSVSRDFTDVRDLASAYTSILESPNTEGKTYNLCSGNSVKISQLVDILAQITGNEMRVRSVDIFQRKNEIPNLVGSHDLITGDTGWYPKFKLKESLSEMLIRYLD